MTAKSRQEIANEFGISVRTLYRWLKRADISLPQGLVTPKFQEEIYAHFGNPYPRNP
jgi:transposase